MKWLVYPRGDDLIVEQLEGSREGQRDVLVKRQGVWYSRRVGMFFRVPESLQYLLRNRERFTRPDDRWWHVKRA